MLFDIKAENVQMRTLEKFNRAKGVHAKLVVLSNLALLLTLLSISNSAFAYGFNAPLHKGWVAGVGYFNSSNPFLTATGDDGSVLPLIGYSGKRFKWFGPSLSYRLNNNDLFTVKAVAEIRFADERSEADSIVLNGLVNKEDTIELGLDLTLGYLTLFSRQDALDEHGSFALGLAVGNKWALSEGLHLEAGVNTVWQHKDVLHYYYGIDAEDATAERPAYTPGNGVRTGAGFQLTVLITSQASLLFGADFTGFGSAIRDSPIVARDSQYSVFAGFVYKLSN